SRIGVAGDAEADTGQGAVTHSQGGPVGRARLRGVVVPGTAAVDALLALARAGRVVHDRVLVIARVEAVPAPSGHVAVHVVQAPRVGLLLADGVSPAARVARVPGVFVELLGVVAERPARLGAGAAGVLPLRLGRQPVAGAAEHRDGRFLDVVVGRQPVLLAE